MSAWRPSSAEQGEAVGVVHPEEARLAGHLGGELVEVALRRGVAVDADERAGGPEPVRDQARVAAGAEGAVDGGLARRRRREVDQLAGEDGDVDAAHVKKDCQGAPSPPRSRRREPPAPPASAAAPRPRGGPPRRPPRPPSRCSACASSGGGSVTRPLASRSISKELPWKKRDILRYSEPIGFRPLSARSMIDSLVSGVQIATQGSGVLARTVPLEKAVRNRVGMLSRFLESSECSKWPRNANGHVPARGT